MKRIKIPDLIKRQKEAGLSITAFYVYSGQFGPEYTPFTPTKAFQSLHSNLNASKTRKNLTVESGIRYKFL